MQGHDDGKTVEEKREEVEEHLSVITKAEKDKGRDGSCLIDIVGENLRNVYKILSEYQTNSRLLLQKKKKNLENLKRKAGDNWIESCLQFVISSVFAAVVQLEENLVRNDTLRRDLGKVTAVLAGAGGLCTTSESLRLSSQGNYIQLVDIDDLMENMSVHGELVDKIVSAGPPFWKQKSELWFGARERVPVTGSNVRLAIGLDGLKPQQRYFDHVIGGKEKEAVSDTVRQAWAHGTKYEPSAVATFCSNFLPVFCPDLEYIEVGGYVYDCGGVKMVISPDGLLVDKYTKQCVAAVEIKCPYFTKVNSVVPERHIPQLQFEMETLNVDKLYFVSFTPETTTVF